MNWKSSGWFAAAAAVVGVLGTIGAAVSVGSDDSAVQSTSWPALVGAAVAAIAAATVNLYTLRRREARRSDKRVFIIYAHEDKAEASAVADWLRGEGFDPWVDTERIVAGQQWKDAVRKGLEGSGAALVLVTPNLDPASGTTGSEIRRAMAEMHSKDRQLSPVIPVIFQDASIPTMMRDFQAVSFADEAGRTKIRDGLYRVLRG